MTYYHSVNQHTDITITESAMLRVRSDMLTAADEQVMLLGLSAVWTISLCCIAYSMTSGWHKQF